ncbi:hypothetical protein HZ326_5661 [Fusarium oxysporum f. sp. albedinis]|nr:hypothetical protein HZ326_5661 [Fusarium oxysporum f. sp. albedinis]
MHLAYGPEYGAPPQYILTCNSMMVSLLQSCHDNVYKQGEQDKREVKALVVLHSSLRSGLSDTISTTYRVPRILPTTSWQRMSPPVRA